MFRDDEVKLAFLGIGVDSINLDFAHAAPSLSLFENTLDNGTPCALGGGAGSGLAAACWTGVIP